MIIVLIFNQVGKAQRALNVHCSGILVLINRNLRSLS